ncbi:hypothetical protein KR038_010768, partial [Drosophila bunnanda]
ISEMEGTSSFQVPPDVDWPVKSNTSDINKVITITKIQDLNLNYYQNRYNLNMRELREEEGLGLPMKMIMDRLVVSMVGSTVMDDVLTGRCDNIDFEDFM